MGLKLSYRKIGDTAALTRMIIDPTGGADGWIEGVQGGVLYECQIDLIMPMCGGVPAFASRR
jgi:hypothetical protein